MKSGKATGPSGVVVEIFRAAGDTGATMIHDSAMAMIRDGKVTADWEQSFSVCLYKGMGDTLDRGNNRGLKLTDQAMKVIEKIANILIRQVVSIDDPSLVLFMADLQQMQFLSSASCRRNGFIWLSWIWRRRLTKFLGN